MADVHDKATRSFNMSQIKSKNTKPEMSVRRFLFSRGFRYKLHDKSLPGNPDIVLPRFRIVIFVHGCFWHGHKSCKYYVIPKTRKQWWSAKIQANSQRDAENFLKIRREGWRVITIFECELRGKKLLRTQPKLISQITRVS